jgi:hypothetical protein
MVLSKDEATRALNEIDMARARVVAMQRYRDAAPYFVLWGCIWLVANCVADVRLHLGGLAWNILTVAGVVGSVSLRVHATRRCSTSPESRDASIRRGWQFGVTWLAILGYFIASFSLLPHLDFKQSNAYISLFWAFLYVLLGIWTGWRICAVGIAAAAATLIGYFALTAHYFLWMGLVTGSLLILGGLWLRKI